MPSVLDSFGECVLKTVNYNSFSVSTPNIVAAAIPLTTFNKIMENEKKYSGFKDLVDNLQTSLFYAFVERKSFPDIKKDSLMYIDDLTKNIMKIKKCESCIAEVGKQYFVYAVNISKSISETKKTQSLEDNILRQILFDGYAKRVSEIIENTLISMEKSFDDSALYV